MKEGGEKTRVICDMNIWYNIASGIIDINDHQDVQLISPGVNFVEFASSEKFFLNKQLVVGALQAVHDYGKVIPYETFDYIIKRCVHLDFDADQTFFFNCIRDFELLLDGEFDVYFKSEKNRKEFQENLEKINLPAQKFADEMTAILPNIRSSGSKDYGTPAKFEKYLIEDGKEFYKLYTNLILHIIAIKRDVAKEILKDKIFWDDIELFFLTWDSFIKDRIIKRGNKKAPGAKIKINDIYDLMNLAYVGKNDLYWTDEKSWLKLIHKDSRTKKYIYNTWSRHLSQDN